MKRRVTSRFYLYFFFTVCCVVLALATARAEPILVCSFFAVSLLLAFRDSRPPELEIKQSIEKKLFFEGDMIEVHIRIRALTTLPVLEIIQPLPPGVQLVKGTSDIVTSLKKEEEKTFTFSFSAAGRRRFEIGIFPVRIIAKSGLSYWEFLHDQRQECIVYPSPDFLRTHIRPFHTHVVTGNYPSNVLGEGVEFGDVRELAAGERANNINWRATARRGKYLANEYVRERNADIVLLVDTFSNIGDAVCNYLDCASRAVATFAHQLLREKNRVGLIEFGFHFKYVMPQAGGRQWYKILEELTTIHVKEREIWSKLNRIPRKILPARALVIAVTPLLDERFTGVLMDLRRRRFDVIAFIVSPVRIAKHLFDSETDSDAIRDIAQRIWAAEWSRGVRDVEQTGMLTTVWDYDQPIELAARMLQRQRRA